MRVDCQCVDVFAGNLSHDTLDGMSSLSVSYGDGLVVDEGPVIAHVGVDADGALSALGIDARIPKVATMLNPTLSETAAGRIIAKNVKTKSATVIKPTTMAFFVFLNRLFPGVFRWLMRL